ncbi:MAG: hypothetical protein ACJAVE_001205 [Polaribacter sp.]|jgi:hypothetical protein|tara:strand:- start:39 stop:212 length:174 start_codon:yes stop_codon:yes gene_type:complete
MIDKIQEALSYYNFKSLEIKNYMNSNTSLTVDEIIDNAEQLSALEYKITALEAANEN